MQGDYVWGMPRRMGYALAAAYQHKERPQVVSQAIWEVQGEQDRLPVDASEQELHNMAQSCVLEVYRYAERYKVRGLILDAVALLCRRLDVPTPLGESEDEQVRRAFDRGWWLRSIRKEHARRFERIAIQCGFVSYKAGVYISNESAIRQRKRNQDNAKLLEKTTMQNEFGQEYSLAELSALGVSNKQIMRGELMTRMRGFEEIAKDLGHVGMFWTITAPSKFHAVLSKSGDMNPNYQGATPREAQAYLCKVWARIRAALKRIGIQPYGFRIAEPHHDGCPHWHMLLFVAKEQAESMEKIICKYALEEDGTEKGAQENRVKLVNIEAGKGTAAGYIAKYVAKNIDGAHVGEHKTKEGWAVVNEMLGGEEITPSARVTLWSQLHGIRQFQQIGGAPIGVWRELRRIKFDRIISAPQNIKDAWHSVQRSGDALASFAGYLRAQQFGSGANAFRGFIRIAKREAEVEGKYATYKEDKPCGVFCISNPNAIYESMRFRWSRVDGGGVGVAFDLPWTGVNNCTDYVPHWMQKQEESNQKFSRDYISEAIRDSQGWDFGREYDKNGKLIRNSWVKYRRPRG
jgi:hypothetical protein